MQRYDPTSIEKKWQQKWEEDGTYTVNLSDNSKPKYFGFSMLPGITGAGIHTGHGRTFQFSDIKVRAKRQQGFNAYHPIGWDSFGLPVENYAIKVGKKPREAHDEALVNFKTQLKRLGYSYDWTKEISTADPQYYRWTQWIFSKLYEHGLAYQKESPQWWCETDQTVLANEQVEGGKCWRCGNQVIKKNLKQWFFKITEYADEMLEATDDLNWTEMVKTMQRNWIGRSEGAEVEFTLSSENNFVLLHGVNGNSGANFLPWVESALKSRQSDVYVPDLPSTDNPNADEQAEYVLQNTTFDEDTVLLGYSYGSVAALKILEKLDIKIKKLVLVAGFAEPGLLSEQRNFESTTNWEFNFEKIKSNVHEIVFLRPQNDTIIPKERAEYLQEKLGGEIVDFVAEKNHAQGFQESVILSQLQPKITVFTTRPDTLFGATFLVLAPEHEAVRKIATDEQQEVINKYIKQAQAKSEIERQETSREKTGVFTGSHAINPATGEKIPIWIADYVLASYGTGAVMAVPAHDERDNAFAQKFNLPIKEVVQPSFIDTDNPPREESENTTRNTVLCIIKNLATNKYLTLRWKKHPWHTFVTGGIEGDEDVVEAAKREITEETGYANLKFTRRMPVSINSLFYAAHKNVNRNITVNMIEFELENEEKVALQRDEIEDFDVEWVKKSELGNLKPVTGLDLIIKWVNEGEFIYSGEGRMINSGMFDGLNSEEAREEIGAWLEQQGQGKSKTQYKMRDWLISRQRYWGAPIPIVHCDKDGAVAIPDDQLPVILPEVDDFKPRGGATSALAEVKEWVNTTCPKCGGPAKRETDTMDGYACSSWYFLRYIDPFNDKQAWNPDQIKHWAPVDFYNGADHAVAHLLYARFWTRFFYKLGLVGDPEPFKRMMYNAYILASDGTKMSKSKGNTIDPLEIMDSGYGADSLRVYEMFIAPYDMEAPWDTRGVPGAYRFLNRTWNLAQEYLEAGEVTLSEGQSAEILKVAHKTIKKVTHDIEHDKFNTAVSAMMEAVNSYFKLKEEIGIGRHETWQFVIESLLQLLAPFAPHIAEELWSQLGRSDTIHVDHWPEWNESYLVSNVMKLPVQINGKVRAMLEVSPDISQDEVIALAKADKKVAPYLEGKELRKAIYVPGRIVNLVI